LTPADLSQPSCRYGDTVLAHYARAAEKGVMPLVCVLAGLVAFLVLVR
jgi:hypothetical protein